MSNILDNKALAGNGIQSEDAVQQIRDNFSKRSAYINASGEFLYDVMCETDEFLYRSLTNGLEVY